MIVKIIISLVIIFIGSEILRAIRDEVCITDLIIAIIKVVKIESRIEEEAGEKYIRGEIDRKEYYSILNNVKIRKDEVIDILSR